MCAFKRIYFAQEYYMIIYDELISNLVAVCFVHGINRSITAYSRTQNPRKTTLNLQIEIKVMRQVQQQHTQLFCKS